MQYSSASQQYACIKRNGDQYWGNHTGISKKPLRVRESNQKILVTQVLALALRTSGSMDVEVEHGSECKALLLAVREDLFGN